MNQSEMNNRYERACRHAADALEGAVHGRHGFAEAVDAFEMVSLWRLALANMVPTLQDGTVLAPDRPDHNFTNTWELMMEATNP